MRGVEVDLAQDLFFVEVEGASADAGPMLRAVEALGYRPSVVEAGRLPFVNGPPTTTIKTGGPFPEPIRAALTQARRERKLVLVDFFAAWCVPCQRMFRETYADARVVHALEGFVFVKVDTDAHSEDARRFGVSGIPDARILTPEGDERGRMLGFRPPEDVLKILDDATLRRTGGNQAGKR